MSCRTYGVKELRLLSFDLFEFTVQMHSDFLDFLGTFFSDSGSILFLSELFVFNPQNLYLAREPLITFLFKRYFFLCDTS